MAQPVPMSLLEVKYIQQGENVYKVLVPLGPSGMNQGPAILPTGESPIVCQVQDIQEFNDQCSSDKPLLTSFKDLSVQFQGVKSLVSLHPYFKDRSSKNAVLESKVSNRGALSNSSDKRSQRFDLSQPGLTEDCIKIEICDDASNGETQSARKEAGVRSPLSTRGEKDKTCSSKLNLESEQFESLLSSEVSHKPSGKLQYGANTVEKFAVKKATSNEILSSPQKNYFNTLDKGVKLDAWKLNSELHEKGKNKKVPIIKSYAANNLLSVKAGSQELKTVFVNPPSKPSSPFVQPPAAAASKIVFVSRVLKQASNQESPLPQTNELEMGEIPLCPKPENISALNGKHVSTGVLNVPPDSNAPGNIQSNCTQSSSSNVLPKAFMLTCKNGVKVPTFALPRTVGMCITSSSSSNSLNRNQPTHYQHPIVNHLQGAENAVKDKSATSFAGLTPVTHLLPHQLERKSAALNFLLRSRFNTTRTRKPRPIIVPVSKANATIKGVANVINGNNYDSVFVTPTIMNPEMGNNGLDFGNVNNSETNMLEMTPSNELPSYLDSLVGNLEEVIETTESTETSNLLSRSETHLVHEQVLDENVIALPDSEGGSRQEVSSNNTKSDTGYILKCNDTAQAKCLLPSDELLPIKDVSASQKYFLEVTHEHVTESLNPGETVDNDATPSRTFVSPEGELANENIGILEPITKQNENVAKGELTDKTNADCYDKFPSQNSDSLSNALLPKNNVDSVNTNLKQKVYQEPLPDYTTGSKNIVDETSNRTTNILFSEHSSSKSIHQIQIPVHIVVIRNPPAYQSKPLSKVSVPTPQLVLKPKSHTQNLVCSSRPVVTMERKIGLLRKVVHRPRLLNRPENKETNKVVANNQSVTNLTPANVCDPSKSASSAQTKETTTTPDAPELPSYSTNKKASNGKKKSNRFKDRRATRKMNISEKRTNFTKRIRSPKVVLKEKVRPLNKPSPSSADGNIPESQRNYGQCTINVRAQNLPSDKESRISEDSSDSDSSSASNDVWPRHNKNDSPSGTLNSQYPLDELSDSSDSDGVSIQCKLVELKMRLMREEGFFSRRKQDETTSSWAIQYCPGKINKIKKAIAFYTTKVAKQRLLRKELKVSRKRNNKNVANPRSNQINVSSLIKPCFVKLFRLNLDSTMLNLAVSTNLPYVNVRHPDDANEVPVQAQEREIKLEPISSENCYLGEESSISYEEEPCTTSTVENNCEGVAIKKEVTESIISIETNEESNSWNRALGFDGTSNIELTGIKDEIVVRLESDMECDNFNKTHDFDSASNTELLEIKTEISTSAEEILQGDNCNRAHCIDSTMEIEISGIASENSKNQLDLQVSDNINSEHSSIYECNAIEANQFKVVRNKRLRGKRLRKKMGRPLNKGLSSWQEPSAAVAQSEAMCDEIPSTSKSSQICDSSKTEIENMCTNTFKDGTPNSNLKSENMILQARTDCILYEAISSDSMSDSQSITQLHSKKRKWHVSECVEKSTVHQHPGLAKSSELQRENILTEANATLDDRKPCRSHPGEKKCLSLPQNKKPKLCNSIAQPLTTRRIVFGPSASSDEDGDSTELSLPSSSFRRTENVGQSESTSFDPTSYNSQSLGTLCNSKSQIDGKHDPNSSASAVSNLSDEGSHFVPSSDKYANLLKLVEEKSRLLKLCRQKLTH